ncbi:MAG: F0F1 ATP synthase subunit delta, partial [bacterium]
MSTILARRYLGALFQIASQRGIVEEVYRELEGLREIISSSNDLKRILFNPAEARTTKMVVWEAIIGEWEKRVAPLNDLT